MKLNRREAVSAAIASLSGAVSSSSAQPVPAYPTAPIRFIIPTAAGGGHDIMMRFIGQKLTERLGQPCVIESRSGASDMALLNQSSPRERSSNTSLARSRSSGKSLRRLRPASC